VRRKGVGAVALGAVLLIAAVVGFVIVPEHKPHTVTSVAGGFECLSNCTTVGWSQTMYDVALIATWAVLIVGALLVVMGLIRYARPEVAR